MALPLDFHLPVSTSVTIVVLPRCVAVLSILPCGLPRCGLVRAQPADRRPAAAAASPA